MNKIELIIGLFLFTNLTQAMDKIKVIDKSGEYSFQDLLDEEVGVIRLDCGGKKHIVVAGLGLTSFKGLENFDLRKVILCNFAHNRFTSLGKLPPMPTLESLNLADNHINELSPDAFDNIPTIKGLNLQRNKLTNLPDAVLRLRYLEYLYLTSDIESLPSSLFLMPSLKMIFLDDKKITINNGN